MDVTQEQQPVQTIAPRGKKRGCFSCAMFCLLVGFVAMTWVLWTVASTGLVRVPLFSLMAFKEPVPTRVVEPVKKDLSTWFQETLVSESVRQARLGIISRDVTFVIPEETLTGLVRTVETSVAIQDVPVDFSTAQIATIDDHLEVFLPILGTSTAITVSVVPIFDEVVGLELNIEALKIGSFRVPKILLNTMVKQVVRLGVGEVATLLESTMTLKELSVTSEGLTVKGELVPGVLPL